MRGLPYLLVALLFTGCVKIEQTVTVAADGSGVQELKIEVAEAVLEEMEKRAQAVSPRGKPNEVRAIFDKAVVKKELNIQGLVLLSHQVKTTRYGKRAVMKAKFKKIEQLSLSSLAGGRADWVFERGPLQGSVRMIYYPRGRDNYRKALAMVKQLGNKPVDQRMRQMFEQRKAELRNIDVRIRVNVPGTVLLTHGHVRETGLQQVEAHFHGRDIKTIQDLLLHLSPRIEVVFDGRKCKFKTSKPSKLDRAPHTKAKAGPPKAPASRPAR